MIELLCEFLSILSRLMLQLTLMLQFCYYIQLVMTDLRWFMKSLVSAQFDDPECIWISFLKLLDHWSRKKNFYPQSVYTHYGGLWTLYLCCAYPEISNKACTAIQIFCALRSQAVREGCEKVWNLVSKSFARHCDFNVLGCCEKTDRYARSGIVAFGVKHRRRLFGDFKICKYC